MFLYLHQDLVKSESDSKKITTPKAKPEGSAPPQPGGGKGAGPRAATGESRGGSYVARVQIGFEKDGSPRYKYFKTLDEYKTWKHNKTRKTGKKSKKTGEALKRKVEKEHRDSKEKQGDAKKTAGSDFTAKSLYIRGPV